MRNYAINLQGPTIVYAMTIITLLTLYFVIPGLFTEVPTDITSDSRLFLRISGRAGLLLLLVSFCARPLHTILPCPATRYFLRNRRYLGISTAMVLWAHYLVLLSMSLTSPDWFKDGVPWFLLLPGSIIFILIGIMALTSNNTFQEKLGIKCWQKIHLLGGYAAASAFVGEYLLVLYIQPMLMPDYQFDVKVSPLLYYALLAVALSIFFLRLTPKFNTPPNR
jgi:methionine sulfoxide reductase heme-binding subunit